SALLVRLSRRTVCQSPAPHPTMRQRAAIDSDSSGGSTASRKGDEQAEFLDTQEQEAMIAAFEKQHRESHRFWKLLEGVLLS
ncbi:unnamed protein product, partial [Closterium sp. NIES-53]